MSQRPTTRADARRQDAKRRLTEHHGTLWQRLSKRISPASLLIWAGFYVAVAATMEFGGEVMPWQLHQRIQNDIRAQVPFEVVDAVATQDRRQAAAASAPDVYVRNPAPLASIRGKLNELLAIAKAAGDDAEKFKVQAAVKGWIIADEAFAVLKDYASSDEKSARYDAIVSRLMARLAAAHIVQRAEAPVRLESPRTAILRSREPEGTGDIEVLTSQLQYVSDTKAVQQIAQEAAADQMPTALQPVVTQLVVETLQGPPGQDPPVLAPLWRYDASATAEAVKEAQDRISTITIQKLFGDLLVPAGTELTNADLDLLKKHDEEFKRVARTDPELRRKKLLSQAGLALLVLLVTMGLAAYTALYQDRVFQKPARTLGLAALMLVVVVATRLIDLVQYPSHPPAEFAVGLVVTAAMLLSIAYNQRFAFGAVGALAILVTLACRGSFNLFIVLLVGMAVAVFALREVRSRSRVVLVGVLAGVGAFIAALAAGLMTGQESKYVISHAVAAGGTALFAGFVVQGILPQFERIFGVATSMTLLEWCDASRPLLRRLAQEAPGTYSHSLVLSQMAEEAAESIGGNGLLARVGALYHDIGKTQKAHYFVENQEARMNRHDRLAPTMSLLIITGHVKDGLEMAKAYGLPRVLHQFICEHHGTTLVKYFLRMAHEAARNSGKQEVSETEFRYPGPKPRSRESAILMLCDGSEGAVRALSEPTPGRIESTVHQVVMDRLTDGQFDECDITLRQLNIVEHSIVKSLGAIHHGRIKYPQEPGATATGSPNLAQAKQPAVRVPPAPQQRATVRAPLGAEEGQRTP